MSRSESSDHSSSDAEDFAPVEEVVDAAAVAEGFHFRYDPLESSDYQSDSNGSGTDASDSPEDDRAVRIGNVEWCKCGHCRPMTDGLQSVCCREMPEVDGLVPEGEPCITAHPTYIHGCLNIHALEIAYYAFRQNRPSLVDAPDIHTRYRLTAYRQFARWVYHYLGPGHREVLPSCAVWKIRDTFPSEAYVGFKYPEY